MRHDPKKFHEDEITLAVQEIKRNLGEFSICFSPIFFEVLELDLFHQKLEEISKRVVYMPDKRTGRSNDASPYQNGKKLTDQEITTTDNLSEMEFTSLISLLSPRTGYHSTSRIIHPKTFFSLDPIPLTNPAAVAQFFSGSSPSVSRELAFARSIPATPISMNPIIGLWVLGGAIVGNLNHWWASKVNANVQMAGNVEKKEIEEAERKNSTANIMRQLDAATAKKAGQQFKPERSAEAVTDLGDFAEDAALDDQLARAIKQSAEEAGIPVPADEHSVREHARDLYSGLAAGAPAAAQHGFMLLGDQPGHTPAAPALLQPKKRPRPAQAATTEELAAAAAREQLAQQQALATGPGITYMQLDNVELDYTAGAAAAYVPQRRPSRSGTHADAVAAAQQPSAFGPEVSHVSLDGSGSAQRHPRTRVFAQANPAYAATGVDLSTLSEDEQVAEAMRRSLLPQG